MPMFHAQDLLAQVFASKGYAVEEGAYGGLVARSGTDVVLIEWKAHGAVTTEEIDALASVMPRVNATRAILVAGDGAPPAIIEQGAKAGIETWPMARAAVEVGMAALESARTEEPAAAVPLPTVAPPTAPTRPASSSAALDPRSAPGASMLNEDSARIIHAKPPKSLIQEAMSASANPSGVVYLPSKPRAPAAEAPRVLPSAWDIASGSASLGVEEIKTTHKHAAAHAAHHGAGAATATVIEAKEDSGAEIVGGSKVKSTVVTAKFPDGATMRLRTAAADAAQRAPTLGRIQTAQLQLIPHITFDYDCRLENEYLPEPIVAKGAVLVNALSGTLVDVPAVELGEALKEGAPQQPRLAALDVYDKVKSHLMKQVSREVKIEREVGGSTVMGTEKIAPSIDELGLNHRGMVLVPVWHLVGEHGTADIEGY
ncbi:MAG: hypothetical protein ACYDDF_14215 [Thermoplasmatota archaeon]